MSVSPRTSLAIRRSPPTTTVSNQPLPKGGSGREKAGAHAPVFLSTFATSSLAPENLKSTLLPGVPFSLSLAEPRARAPELTTKLPPGGKTISLTRAGGGAAVAVGSFFPFSLPLSLLAPPRESVWKTSPTSWTPKSRCPLAMTHRTSFSLVQTWLVGFFYSGKGRERVDDGGKKRKKSQSAFSLPRPLRRRQKATTTKKVSLSLFSLSLYFSHQLPLPVDARRVALQREQRRARRGRVDLVDRRLDFSAAGARRARVRPPLGTRDEVEELGLCPAELGAAVELWEGEGGQEERGGLLGRCCCCCCCRGWRGRGRKRASFDHQRATLLLLLPRCWSGTAPASTSTSSSRGRERARAAAAAVASHAAAAAQRSGRHFFGR